MASPMLSSPPSSDYSPSPPSSPARMTFAVPSVVNILIKMLQTKERSKARIIECDSGEPQTHTTLAAPGETFQHKVPIERRDVFVCADAVDLSKLLRSSRVSLFDMAESLGANVLVDEQWGCTIYIKPRSSTPTFRVQIRYSASATRSQQRRDPQNPVALNRATGVPGLMTVIDRL